jgi:hypothetical protein
MITPENPSRAFPRFPVVIMQLFSPLKHVHDHPSGPGTPAASHLITGVGGANPTYTRIAGRHFPLGVIHAGDAIFAVVIMHFLSLVKRLHDHARECGHAANLS